MIKRYFFLVWRLLLFKMSSKLMYRFDFWSAFFADGGLFIVQILMFGTIFAMVEDINGWAFYQIVIFTGTFTLVDGLAMGTYFFGLISLPEKIRSGELDRYIVKPVNTLFYVAFDSLNPGSLFVSILGAVIVVVGVNLGNVSVSVISALSYMLSLVAMYVLMFSLMVLLRSIAFWVVRIQSLMDIEDRVIELGFRIPGSAFKGGFKVFFMILVPYALIASGPTYILTAMAGPWMYLWTFGSSALFLGLAIAAFNKGLSIYSSASS